MNSPTGLGIRSDADGDGHFGAARGDHDHRGIDLLAHPGQPLVMPITYGLIKRMAYPYKYGGEYQGAEIKGHDADAGDIVVKLFYMVPFQIGVEFLQGQLIGWAQDISIKYGRPMLPHIHLEARQDGKLINPEDYLDRRFL